MNNIPTKQNEELQIERLAAQRELYSSAKRFYNIEVIGSVAIPILATIGTAFSQSVSFYAAIYGISFYLLDSLLVEPEVNKRRSKAAKIQELFDCDVLDLQKSSFKTVSDISVEDVLTSYDAHNKIRTNIERLKDWYPTSTGKLEISIGRLVCQRLNYCWDSRLRNGYSGLIKTVNVLVAILVIIIFAFGRLDGNYAPLILTALLPFFRFSIKQYKDNQESCLKLSKLNTYFDSLWKDIKDNKFSDSELNMEARRIQDEIYDNRMKNSLIPDIYFWFYRNRDQNSMERTAELLIDDFKNAVERS